MESNFIRKVYSFFNKKWYFDKIYTDLIVNKLLAFGYNTSFKTFDRGFIEMFGPYGLTNVVTNIIPKIIQPHPMDCSVHGVRL